MISIALLAVLSADAAPAAVEEVPQRILRSEVGAGTGVLGSAYTATGARFGDTLWAFCATGRGVWGGFTAQLEALALVPLAREGMSSSFLLVPRFGWAGYRWTVTAGVAVQFVAGAKPIGQVMPSIRAQVDFGSLGLSAGVFDFYGQVPLHLSAEVGPFSIGWVAPLGAVASVRWKLPMGFWLRAHGFVYRLFNSEAAMLSVGASWEGAS